VSNIRVMFVGHGPSNLPEDEVVNVFHFQKTGDYATNVGDTLTQVEAFYTAVYSGNTVGQFLSPWVQRTAQLRAYDLLTDPPRIPTIQTLSLPSAESNSGLPEEVAICLSYHGAVPPALTPHRRGRIYFGPLCTTAYSIANTTNPARPSTSVTQTLGLAAAALVLSGAGWAVRTKHGGTGIAPGFLTLIHDGYVDNALDTQRRRGPRTTARTAWPVG